jgi:lambda repressor-like predicted transcriptional regulator
VHPEDIKAAIRKQSQTLTSIAAGICQRNGATLTKGAISRVLHGNLKSARIARRISEVTGIPVKTLWPGKYPELASSQWALTNQHHPSRKTTTTTPHGA